MICLCHQTKFLLRIGAVTVVVSSVKVYR